MYTAFGLRWVCAGVAFVFFFGFILSCYSCFSAKCITLQRLLPFCCRFDCLKAGSHLRIARKSLRFQNQKPLSGLSFWRSRVVLICFDVRGPLEVIGHSVLQQWLLMMHVDLNEEGILMTGADGSLHTHGQGSQKPCHQSMQILRNASLQGDARLLLYLATTARPSKLMRPIGWSQSRQMWK